jgi:hypothetical protein
MWLTHFPNMFFDLAGASLDYTESVAGVCTTTHSAELAANDEDSALVQHTGIQMQHVVHIHSHKIFCQISLGERGQQGLWLVLFVLITKSI